jgi:hypothetical protein
MVEPKLTLFQMQVEGARVHAAKANQPGLGVPPESFNAVNVSMPFGKFVLTVIDAQMLAVTDVNQAVVTAPAVRIDDAFEFDFATNNRLQRGFGAIRNDFGVNVTIPLKDESFALASFQRPGSAQSAAVAA